MLLHPTVKGKMHLQENTLFDLDIGVKVTGNVAQCPLHHVTYAPTRFEVTTSKGLRGDAFTRNALFDIGLGVKVTQNSAQYPHYHVTYSATKATKFEVAMSNGLGGDAFTRNVTDGWMDGQTDRLWYEINIPFLSKEKSR